MFWGMMNDRCLCLGLPRSFDTDKDEHPVKFVIDNLKEGILETVYSWLSDIAGDDRSDAQSQPSTSPRGLSCPKCAFCLSALAAGMFRHPKSSPVVLETG